MYYSMNKRIRISSKKGQKIYKSHMQKQFLFLQKSSIHNASFRNSSMSNGKAPFTPLCGEVESSFGDFSILLVGSVKAGSDIEY